ncbi:YusW family protein [Savagea faecisuis]|uniref:YusW family protein n=1 Tax=Savagea faecisuis TaxID=1274803 RepID=A0ABW3GT64_9BACL
MKNKQLTMSALILSGALVLGACGNDGNKEAPEPEQQVTPPTTEQEDNAVETPEVETETPATESQTGEVAATNFEKFEVEIDVDGKDAVDLEYDKNDPTDNEYKNYVTNEAFKGADATAKVEEFVNALKLTETSSEEEVIAEVTKALGIDAYSKIEVEYKYADGTKVEVKDKK